MKVYDARITSHESRAATQILLQEDGVRVVAFRLDAGQRVPEHSSQNSVYLAVIQGSGLFHGAGGAVEARAGDVVAYGPGEPHAIDSNAGVLAFIAFIIQGREPNS
jgi:quercetin dioxygenase-like cupin family protein